MIQALIGLGLATLLALGFGIHQLRERAETEAAARAAAAAYEQSVNDLTQTIGQWENSYEAVTDELMKQAAEVAARDKKVADLRRKLRDEERKFAEASATPECAAIAALELCPGQLDILLDRAGDSPASGEAAPAANPDVPEPRVPGGRAGHLSVGAYGRGPVERVLDATRLRR